MFVLLAQPHSIHGEHIVSTFNLGLQCVGLAREQMSEEHEQLVAKAGSMKEIRKLSQKHPDLREAVLDSVATAKIRLSEVIGHLQLEGENFKCFCTSHTR